MNRRTVIFIACALFAGSTAEAAPQVTLNGVTVEGAVSNINSDVDVYYAIPYASAARWSPPKAHALLSNPFDASSLANAVACPQATAVVIGTRTITQSEDCLQLSVHVPAAATPSSKLPVLVWIHGGSLTSETGLDYLPDDMVASNDIVAVTINYRLGALGWLAHKDLEASTADAFENAGDAGNYGLMDQQFALAWVKKHIAAFGGDPKKVTIAGESAGGLSASLQLASTTAAAGLFRGAIIESGAYDLHDLPTKATYETTFGSAFVDAVLVDSGTVHGIFCPSLVAGGSSANIRTCLSAAGLSTILNVQQTVFGPLGISPDTGTLVVPHGLEQAFSAGNFIHVPVLQGSNANEGRYFEPVVLLLPGIPLATAVAAGGPANYYLSNANDLCAALDCTFSQEINIYLNLLGLPAATNSQPFDLSLKNTYYPLGKFPDPYLADDAPSADEALSQIVTDYEFSCNTIDSNSELAKYTSVYAYEFNDPSAPPAVSLPPLSALPNDQYGFPTASEHGAELTFLFAFPNTGNLSASEQTLETAMQSYWGNFVNNLDPNKGTAEPNWASFSSKGIVQNLTPIGTAGFKTFETEHKCTLWEPIIAAE